MATELAVVKSKSTPLQRLIEDYLAEVQAKGHSRKTRDLYGIVLTKVFLPFCSAEGITEPSELDQRVLNRLSVHLQEATRPDGKPRSPHTTETYLRTCSHFVNYAKKEGEVAQGVKVQRPKVGRQLMWVPTRQEIQAMEDAADNERDKLLVRVLADTGIRASELLGLRNQDLVESGPARFVRVTGKGNLARDVPISPRLYRRLRTFATKHRPMQDEPYIWWGRLRLAGNGKRQGGERPKRGEGYGRLSISGLEQVIRQLSYACGLVDEEGKARCHPHLLRHAHATWSLNRGLSMKVIQENLGHKDLTMLVSTYSHLTSDDRYAATMKLFQEDE